MDPAQPMDERDIEAERPTASRPRTDRDHVLSGLALEGHQQRQGSRRRHRRDRPQDGEMARRSLNEGAIRALETMIQQDFACLDLRR